MSDSRLQRGHKWRHGWQQAATDAVHTHLVETFVRPRLRTTKHAMLRFQGGPLSGVPFTSFPTSVLSRFDASQWARATLANFYLGQFFFSDHCNYNCKFYCFLKKSFCCHEVGPRSVGPSRKISCHHHFHSFILFRGSFRGPQCARLEFSCCREATF